MEEGECMHTVHWGRSGCGIRGRCWVWLLLAQQS